MCPPPSAAIATASPPALLAALLSVLLPFEGPAALAAGALPPEQEPAAPPAAVPQIPRDGWKDCLYNDRTIRCRDLQSPGMLRIFWIDGIRSTFTPRSPLGPGLPVHWRDSRGGLWRRELLPQGNTLLTQLGNGNRILVPLRFPCRPPLKGEVGYCRP